MKKFDIKDVFSWSNAEDAKQYIGKEGYFADNLNDLQECVSNNNFQTLFSLDLDPETDVDSIFSITEIDYKYALFIPADKVKEVKEKKWRPFKTIEEFFDIYNKNVGSLITYRVKVNPLREITTSIIGYIKEANGEDQLQIGLSSLQLSTWHEITEIWNEESWQPFGVEDKE